MQYSSVLYYIILFLIFHEVSAGIFYVLVSARTKEIWRHRWLSVCSGWG